MVTPMLAATAEAAVCAGEEEACVTVDAIGMTADHTCKAVSVNLPQELVAALSRIWEDQKFTDVDFLLGSEVIPAHKAVLAAHSPYFESMLYGSMREASMREIVLEGVPVTAFRKVLQFAYTGSLHMENVPLQDILEVSSVADRFGFVSLKEALGDQLSQSHISLDTVLLLFVHSDTYHLQQLHKSCLNFIEKEENTTRVLHHPSLLLLPQEALAAILSRDTFMTPEIEILRAVKQWKEHNSKKVGEIATLLDCVRLSEFSSAEEVFQEVEPMGLLDSQAILAGVRVMCKPCLSEMKPRGKIEKNKNLFTNPTVDFDPATRPTIQQPPQQAQLPYARGYVIAPPTKLCVADTVILMGERAKSRGYQRLPTPSQRSPDTVIVALGDRYIINCLSIKGYPSESDDDQMKDKWFSYTVSISRDKNSWLKLFDYSSFACWGTQNLPFPRQAARFVRLDLKWRYNMRRELPLQFSACCLVSDPRPFAFLPNGVIAPRYDHDVVAVSYSYMKDEADGQWTELCWTVFRQPYSISCLRFSLECTDKDIDSVDIRVEVGLLEVGSVEEPDVSEGSNSSSDDGGTVFQPAGGLQLGGGLRDQALGQVASIGGVKSPASGEEEDVKLRNKLKLKDIDKAPLNEPITVELKEKVVNSMTVHIREVHRKPSPPTTIQPLGLGSQAGSSSMPVPKLEPAAPTFSFGQAVQGRGTVSQQPTFNPPDQKRRATSVPTSMQPIFFQSSQATQFLPQTAAPRKRSHHRQRRAENVGVGMGPSAAFVVENASNSPSSLVQGSTASPVCFKIVNIIVKSSIQ